MTNQPIDHLPSHTEGWHMWAKPDACNDTELHNCTPQTLWRSATKNSCLILCDHGDTTTLSNRKTFTCESSITYDVAYMSHATRNYFLSSLSTLCFTGDLLPFISACGFPCALFSKPSSEIEEGRLWQRSVCVTDSFIKSVPVLFGWLFFLSYATWKENWHSLIPFFFFFFLFFCSDDGCIIAAVRSSRLGTLR